MLKIRIKILIWATMTVALASLAGTNVTPAHATALDPVEDPTYWTTIWDHVGALNPSGVNPTADWVATESAWAADGYAVDSASAAAAKAAIDAQAFDTTAMEIAGSIPATDAALAAVLSPEFLLPAAAGLGVYALVGSGAGQRLIHFFGDGLFGSSSFNAGDAGTGFTLTGREKWTWQTTIPSFDFPSKPLGPAWEAEYEVKNNSTGALSTSSSTVDCLLKGTACTPYEIAKSQVFTGHPGTDRQDLDSTTGTPCTSTPRSCQVQDAETSPHFGAAQIESPGTHTPTFTTITGGAQTDPGTSSQKARDVRNAIESSPRLHQQYNCKLDPADYVCPTLPGTTTTTPTTTPALAPLYLPTPFPGETVGEYAERLRSKQFVGAITVVDDAMSYPSNSPALALNPTTLTRIRVGTSTVPLYDAPTGQPLPWPGPATVPQIQTTSTATAVELTEVPPTYTPSGSGGGIHMPGISFACQFPFGFYCWAETVTGWFNVTPQAPDFNFTIPDQTVGGNTYHVGSHYDVNLNVMDSYMAIFRGVISVVLWVGGIYWLAVKLLGFHPGGDPGEAIDEGLDFDGL